MLVVKIVPKKKSYSVSGLVENPKHDGSQNTKVKHIFLAFMCQER